MRILITGNMGYVGPVVLARLREAWPRATLIGLDQGYFAHCLTGTAFLPECRADIQYLMDVRHIRTEVLQGVDAIVHLAAISNDPMGHRFENATDAINFRASVALAALARRLGVKSFVFASSCSMYGVADDTPRTETSALNPLTAYARSKVSAEEGLRALANDGFQVTCLRFATACGMSPRLRLDLVMNDFVACAVSSGTISILSDGTPWRPLIHVKDMARAIEWALGREAGPGPFVAVNAGSNGWNYRVSELAAGVAAVVPGVDIAINRSAPVDSRSYRVDFSLFEQLAPAHQPLVGLHDTVSELKAGLEAMDFRDASFRSSGFMRLEVLKRLQAGGLVDDELVWSPQVRSSEA